MDGCLVMEYSTDGKRRGVVLPEGTWYDEADRTIVHGDDSLLLDDDARLLPATGFTAEQLEATAPDDCSNASYVVIWELRPVERAPEND